MIWDEFLYELVVWLGLAFLAGGMLTGVRMLLGKLWPKGLLPPQRQFAAPWGLHEIVAAVVFYMFLVAFLGALLRDIAVLLELAPRPDSEAAKADTLGYFVWGMALAGVPAVLFSLRLLYVMSETEPYQAGLRTDRIGADLTAGFLAWLMLTPPILLLHALVVSFFVSQGVDPQPHELLKLTEEGKTPPIVMVGMVLMATFSVPVAEEFLFRGLILKWAVLRNWGTDLLMGLAFACGVLGRADELQTVGELGWRAGLEDFALAAAPALFVLALIPLYIFIEFLAWPWLPRPNVARAIFAQAVLFAMVHFNNWPNQIALFLLGLGLGALAYRTQSLLGPITFHGLFNAIACMVLILNQGKPISQPKKGKPETTAVVWPVGVSTASSVPGP
ncbi:MAG: CPBP family glutamic-type intramembrane protease [Gemmataceae bacterium]